MPTDLIGVATPVTAYIMDGNMYEMVSKSSAVSILSVTKPSGQAASQATGLVSFGKNPNDATEITNGVAVYSSPFCLASNALATNQESNCGITSAFNANPVVSGATKILDVTNSIEVTWALPYDIPNDRTQADIVCKTEQKSGASGALQEYTYDPLVIHQSSIMAKGWGVGNCFYMGAGGLGTGGQHLFQCRDIGKLAKSSSLQLAFQFHITNEGKGYAKGVHATATNNIVTLVALTLSCELKIGTYSAAKTSAKNWYTSMFTTNIDGNTQTSVFGRWSTWVAVKADQASLGVKTVAGDKYKLSEATNEAAMWIFHSAEDVVVRADNKRQFPFNTKVTDKELYFRGYGSGLKTATTFTALTTTIAKGTSSIYNRNNFVTVGDFLLDTGSNINAAKAGVSGQSAGMVYFKYAAAAWGGSCCNPAATCSTQGTSNLKQCTMLDGNKLKLFATNDINEIAHNSVNEKSASFHNEALTSIVYNGVMDMPAYYTTIRGRGGFGASTQKLVDIFWSMSSNNAASPSLQVLMHFYVIVKTPVADADMKVSFGFPLNVFQVAASKMTANLGNYAVSVGMKLYIAPSAVPVAKYFGFFAARMTPFFMNTGGN